MPDCPVSNEYVAVRAGPGIDELQRDKVNLDIFWLRDESLEDSADLPAPDVLARQIARNLEAAIDQVAAISRSLTEE